MYFREIEPVSPVLSGPFRHDPPQWSDNGTIDHDYAFMVASDIEDPEGHVIASIPNVKPHSIVLIRRTLHRSSGIEAFKGSPALKLIASIGLFASGVTMAFYPIDWLNLISVIVFIIAFVALMWSAGSGMSNMDMSMKTTKRSPGFMHRHQERWEIIGEPFPANSNWGNMSTVRLGREYENSKKQVDKLNDALGDPAYQPLIESIVSDTLVYRQTAGKEVDSEIVKKAVSSTVDILQDFKENQHDHDRSRRILESKKQLERTMESTGKIIGDNPMVS